jgi:GntR family transcriptional regulator
MMGFCGEHSNTGEKVESIVHDFSVVCPPADVAECLGMDEDQFAYHIIRVRLADGKPLAIEYTYMPIDVIPDLRKKTLYASIYEYIEGDLGLKIDSAHRIVRAVMPTAEECDWLSITEDEPLLEIEQVGYLDDGTPFEYSVSKHPDSYEFRSISSK